MLSSLTQWRCCRFGGGDCLRHVCYTRRIPCIWAAKINRTENAQQKEFDSTNCWNTIISWILSYKKDWMSFRQCVNIHFLNESYFIFVQCIYTFHCFDVLMFSTSNARRWQNICCKYFLFLFVYFHSHGIRTILTSAVCSARDFLPIKDTYFPL